MKNLSFIIISILILSSCVSTKQRAHNLIRKGHEKIEAGLELDPSLVDSVNKARIIYIEVPVTSGEQDIETKIDSSAFEQDINNYDSLLLASDSLHNLIASGNAHGIQLENTAHNLRKANDHLNNARSKFIKGYAVDSVYQFEDSILTASIEIKDGQVHNFKYKTKPRGVSESIETQIINLDGRKMIGNFWEDAKFYWFVGALIAIVLILALRKIIR